MLRVQMEDLPFDLLGDTAIAFLRPLLLILEKTVIAFRIKTVFPVVKGGPSDVGCPASRRHVVVGFPCLEEKFPLLRSSWWKIDAFCVHTPILSYRLGFR